MEPNSKRCDASVYWNCRQHPSNNPTHTITLSRRQWQGGSAAGVGFPSERPNVPSTDAPTRPRNSNARGLRSLGAIEKERCNAARKETLPETNTERNIHEQVRLGVRPRNHIVKQQPTHTTGESHLFKNDAPQTRGSNDRNRKMDYQQN